MTPGTVLCDREFQFKDGDTGKKLLVVLGGGLPNHYVIILTTSKQKTKGRQEGCQPKDRLHNYFLPEGSCCLSGDSWLLLNSVYNFEAEKLLARSLSGFISHIGCIDRSTMLDILYCASLSMDITESQERIIQDTIAAL
jgi:hypothetical protein